MNVTPNIKPKMPPYELSKDTENNGIKGLLQSQVNRQKNREEK